MSLSQYGNISGHHLTLIHCFECKYTISLSKLVEYILAQPSEIIQFFIYESPQLGFGMFILHMCSLSFLSLLKFKLQFLQGKVWTDRLCSLNLGFESVSKSHRSHIITCIDWICWCTSPSSSLVYSHLPHLEVEGKFSSECSVLSSSLKLFSGLAYSFWLRSSMVFSRILIFSSCFALLFTRSSNESCNSFLSASTCSSRDSTVCLSITIFSSSSLVTVLLSFEIFSTTTFMKTRNRNLP